ncbi:MAG TPA: DUF4382 domain-containing protein [Nitrospiraceae bacterium]|nr:DUF4382 domain-containing protein [Nitrospiraceae bacterium]
MNTLKKNSKPLIWFMGLLLAGVVAGCGGDGGGSTQPGTASVSMTDAPACGFDKVNVTVSKVRIHQSDSASDNGAGWTDITLNPPRKINLLDLNYSTNPNPNFALESLGETPLPAGHYTQLRLVLDRNTGQSLANSVVLENTTDEIALDTPSAVQSGIKLIHQFNVGSGQRVDLLLDFDACHSIVKTGNGTYKLKPVIKVIPYALNGIQGFVDKSSFANQSLVGKNVTASAQFNGGIVRSTVVNTDTGKFFIAHLDPANDYDVVITADDHATAVIAAVPVDPAPVITIISTSAAPFSLANSSSQAITGKVTLSPADDDGTVIVAAKQKLDSGLIVTVKSVVASVLDSADPIGDYQYNMTLPTGAPSFASYNAIPPPITPTDAAQALVAKIYTVQGSAQVVTTTGTTIYATQNPAPSPKDITIAANQTQDFTLSAP